MADENLRFEYTYSAKTQSNKDEINAIREKYLPVVDNKLETLRKLDRSVERQGLIVALSQGITGTFILGFSASLVGERNGVISFWGIVIGIVGAILLICAYPAFKKAIKKQKEKVAPQILKLSEELAGENITREMGN